MHAFIPHENTLGTGGDESASWDNIYVPQMGPVLLHEYREARPLTSLYYRREPFEPFALPSWGTKDKKLGLDINGLLEVFGGLCS